MTKRNLARLVLVLAVVTVGVVFLPRILGSKKQGQVEGITVQKSEPQPVEAGGFEYGDLIKQALLQNKSAANFSSAQIGITSHHLPTAVSFIAQFYNAIKQTQSPHKTFVVIGPDHYEHCHKSVSTTRRSYYTPFGILDSNNQIIDDLEQNANVAEIDDCFDGEHSIGVHSMFIKSLYPDSTIVPLIYSSAAPDSVVEKVAQVLAKYKNDITVVVSVDFSHYQSTQIANQLDKDSGAMIQKLDGSGFTMKHMDSPASVKTAIALAKLWKLKPQMLQHTNSYEYTGQADNTTGYWNILFTP